MVFPSFLLQLESSWLVVEASYDKISQYLADAQWQKLFALNYHPCKGTGQWQEPERDTSMDKKIFYLTLFQLFFSLSMIGGRGDSSPPSLPSKNDVNVELGQ